MMLNALKMSTQELLKRMGLYHRVKASRLYDVFWMIADRRVIHARQREIDFYRTCLRGFRPGDLIFDIGANEGHKTGVFLRMGAGVIAVEPDDGSQEVLKHRFLRARLTKPSVVVVGMAVSDHDAVETMWIDAPGCAKNTLSQKWVDVLRQDDKRFGARLTFSDRREVNTISLDNLIGQYGRPFFIKIDVEGHEPHVLRGLRRPVPYLSFEVNLPEFRSEGRECIALLAALAPDGVFNYAGDVERGMMLEHWLSAQDFFDAFSRCTERSIEVFFRTPSALCERSDEITNRVTNRSAAMNHRGCVDRLRLET